MSSVVDLSSRRSSNNVADMFVSKKQLIADDDDCCVIVSNDDDIKEVVENRYIYADWSERAKVVLYSVYKIEKSNHKDFTMNQLVDIMKGSKIKKILDCGWDKLACYSKFKSFDKTDLTRMIRKMISENILKEDMKTLQYDNIVAYLRCGEKAKDLISNRIKFEMPVHLASSKNAQQKAVAEEEDDNTRKLHELAKENETLFDHSKLTFRPAHENREFASTPAPASSNATSTNSGLIDVTNSVQNRNDKYDDSVGTDSNIISRETTVEEEVKDVAENITNTKLNQNNEEAKPTCSKTLTSESAAFKEDLKRMIKKIFLIHLYNRDHPKELFPDA